MILTATSQFPLESYGISSISSHYMLFFLLFFFLTVDDHLLISCISNLFNFRVSSPSRPLAQIISPFGTGDCRN